MTVQAMRIIPFGARLPGAVFVFIRLVYLLSSLISLARRRAKVRVLREVSFSRGRMLVQNFDFRINSHLQ
jgi:hypothetical protein